MARSTMDDLIALVRLQTAATTDDFTDDEVESFLDRHRMEVFNDRLTPEVTYEGATSSYKDYLSSDRFYEADAVIIDGTNATVSAGQSDSFDYLTGRFTFGTGRTDRLRISGKTYDLHLACAELLEAWAAKVALDFDFTTDQQTFNRSQKREGLLALAKAQRRQARVGSGRLVRTDERPTRPPVYINAW